jgi:hypothetical protein
MVSFLRLAGDKISAGHLTGSEQGMHPDSVRQPCSGKRETRFTTILKGAVGVSFLLTAVAGTLHGWLGDPGSPDPLLNPAAIIGAVIGATAMYVCGRNRP